MVVEIRKAQVNKFPSILLLKICIFWCFQLFQKCWPDYCQTWVSAKFGLILHVGSSHIIILIKAVLQHMHVHVYTFDIICRKKTLGCPNINLFTRWHSYFIAIDCYSPLVILFTNRAVFSFCFVSQASIIYLTNTTLSFIMLAIRVFSNINTGSLLE